jgi:hypothetical protein
MGYRFGRHRTAKFLIILLLTFSTAFSSASAQKASPKVSLPRRLAIRACEFAIAKLSPTPSILIPADELLQDVENNSTANSPQAKVSKKYLIRGLVVNGVIFFSLVYAGASGLTMIQNPFLKQTAVIIENVFLQTALLLMIAPYMPTIMKLGFQTYVPLIEDRARAASAKLLKAIFSKQYFERQSFLDSNASFSRWDTLEYLIWLEPSFDRVSQFAEENHQEKIVKELAAKMMFTRQVLPDVVNAITTDYIAAALGRSIPAPLQIKLGDQILTYVAAKDPYWSADPIASKKAYREIIRAWGFPLTQD